MGIFSGSSKQDGLVAIFDIGSASVGGALMEVSDNGDDESLPTMVWARREYIPFQKKLNPERFEKSIKEAFKSISEGMAKNASGHPARVFCVLSSPWYASQTREASFTSIRPVLVTRKFLSQLARKEIGLIKEKEEEKYGNGNISVIEKNNMEVRLNGYPTDMPYNKKAEEVSISLYASVGQRDFMSDISQMAEEVFHTNHVDFYTLSFISFATMRDMFPEKADFLVCDVSGEVTDISIVQNDVLVETVSVPVGRNLLLRTVIKSLGVDKEEALSLIKLFLGEQLSPKTQDKVGKVLGEVEDEWKAEVNKAIDGLSKYFPLPTDLYLTAGVDTEEWFVKVLGSSGFKQKLDREDGSGEDILFSVFQINRLFLRQFVGFKGVVERDPFLILETVFVNKLLNL